MITAKITRIIIIRMIHSLTFCHHSLRLSLVAVRWNISAFWFRYSVCVCVCLGGTKQCNISILVQVLCVCLGGGECLLVLSIV